MARLAAFCLLTVTIFIPASSQVSVTFGPASLHAGKIGLGIDGLNEWPNLLMKYFINNQLALEALVGAEVSVPGGSAPAGQVKQNGVTLRGGLGVLFHLTQNQMSPYVGGSIVYEREQEGGFFAFVPEPEQALVASLVAGGEYFANERFSFGLKQLLGVEFTFARHENSQVYPDEPAGKRFKTSTMFTGRYYFN